MISPPPCPGGNLYTIRAGDTFFSIARRFRVSLDDLLEANPGVDPDNLQIGQQICIPLAVPPVQCPPGSSIYTIRPGDTFFTIARRFGISVQELVEANPGVDPDTLLVGQQICVPAPPLPGVCPEGSSPYVIRAGDTFFSLARRFNTTVEAIQAANPGVNPNNLQIGQVICIPGVPPGPCPAGTQPYTIRAGDTFFSLARRFNTTVEAIQRANPGVNPNNLQIGQVICIPGAPPGPCPAGTQPYTIRAGDTFFSLARRFNTTVEAIQRANPGVNPDNLQIGQVICIPQ